MTLRHAIVAALAAVSMAAPAAAEPFHDQVVGCLSTMQTDEDWAACRAALFAPCPTEVAGSQKHVACLREQEAGWEAYLQARHERLVERLTGDGAVALTTLVGQWRGYVGDRCAQVASQKPEVGEAADLGCRISQISGLATELSRCENGVSGEPYCELKDK